MDDYLAQTKRKYKGENASYDPEAFKDKASINLARAAIAAVLDDMAESSKGMMNAGQRMLSTHDIWQAMLAQYRKEMGT